jgi:hypothetical protein
MGWTLPELRPVQSRAAARRVPDRSERRGLTPDLIDCHVHMLPGIDDGARDLGQALDMARLAVADGIVMAAVTPHHLNGTISTRQSASAGSSIGSVESWPPHRLPYR